MVAKTGHLPIWPCTTLHTWLPTIIRQPPVKNRGSCHFRLWHPPAYINDSCLFRKLVITSVYHSHDKKFNMWIARYEACVNRTPCDLSYGSEHFAEAFQEIDLRNVLSLDVWNYQCTCMTTSTSQYKMCGCLYNLQQWLHVG